MNQAKNEINQLIERHGMAMTREQLERVLDFWDRGVVRGEDVSKSFALLKAELERPGLSRQQRLFASSRQNQKKLTGHQMAAHKAGLDVNTNGLERMSFEEMKSLAEQQQRERAESMRLKHSCFYRHGMAQPRQGNTK